MFAGLFFCLPAGDYPYFRRTVFLSFSWILAHFTAGKKWKKISLIASDWGILICPYPWLRFITVQLVSCPMFTCWVSFTPLTLKLFPESIVCFLCLHDFTHVSSLPRTFSSFFACSVRPHFNFSRSPSLNLIKLDVSSLFS